MKRFCLAVLLAVGFAANAAPAFAQPAPGLAPADRYFGRLKMSILGVRNSLTDLSARLAAHPEDAVPVYEHALLVDDALHDWATQFPRDPWIPRFAHALADLYRKVDTEDARIRKNDTLDWLIADYPQSEFARRPRI
jgi:hypothetical protein